MKEPGNKAPLRQTNVMTRAQWLAWVEKHRQKELADIQEAQLEAVRRSGEKRMSAGGPHCYCTKPHRNARHKELNMKETNMTEIISRIEEGLIAISLNPERSFVAILEEMKVPYYNILTSFLAQRGVLEKVGNRLRWVGDPPTRTLAGLIYEQCRSAGVGGRPNKSKAKASKARIAHAAIYGNDLPEEAK